MLSRLSLRSILLADVILTGATGLLMAAGAWFLDDLLDLPTNLIWISGIILIVYVGALWALRQSEPISHLLVEASAATNLAWGAGCTILLLAEWTDPNPLGVAFILLQVAVVIVFAALQLNAVRRESHTQISRVATN
jgi:hypothetical protein